MNRQRVTLITLGVADLAAARAFYARLGWVERGSNPGVAFYQMRGALTPADDRAGADLTCLHLSGNRSRAIHAKAAGALMVLQLGARDASADPDLPGIR